MRLARLAGYGAIGVLLALPSLLLLAVTVTGLVLTVALLGFPLLLGGLLLVAAVARLDRWLLNRLVGAEVEEPEPWSAAQPWRRTGLVRVTRDTTFVVARSSIGLVTLVLLAASIVVAVAGVGSLTIDGFLSTGQWESTSGWSSWWGPLLLLAAGVVAAVVLVVAGYLQTTLAPLLGPTESRRLERARHRQTLADERARLAADLHDAVGHSLSVTTLQAAAAARVVRTDPRFVADTLQRIEVDSRRALAEIDRALALLSGSAPVGAPDADQLFDLLAALRAAGLSVTEDIAVPAGLPADVSQAVYRIVQEAGTNTLRHGSDDRFVVSISSTDDEVVVSVVSSKRDGPDRSLLGPGGGRGLDGLRTRCNGLGGSLVAGSSPDGQDWVVTATLPFVPGSEAEPQ